MNLDHGSDFAAVLRPVLPGCLIGAVIALAGTARAQAQEFFGCLGGYKVDRMDASSGNVIQTTTMTPGATPFVPWGLSHDGAKLISIDWLGLDRVLTIHPTATSFTLGPHTGTDSPYSSLEVHPQTGVVYFTDTFSLFTLAPATGVVTLIAPFTGLAGPADYITAIAIDSAGGAIGCGWNHVGNFNYMYQIDLPTGVCTALGVLHVGSGRFRDLAFNVNGDLWGSWEDDGTPALGGLYKIDIVNLTAMQKRSMPQPYLGLAFGPSSSPTTYCTAKTNSLGCTPTMAVNGIASLTANAGFAVQGSQSLNQRAGRMIFGVSGRASTPFANGTLCLSTPFVGSHAVSAGGTSLPFVDCSGMWTVDFNAVQHAWPLFPSGSTVQVQWIGRDPGFAPPNNLQLSNAVEFTLLP